MKSFVLDIGNSNMKLYGYDLLNIEDPQCWSEVHRTPTEFSELLESAVNLLGNATGGGHPPDSLIVLSFGDSICYETKYGEITGLRADHPIAFQKRLPSYERSGKPRLDDLKGAGNQMLYLAKDSHLDLDDIYRILPWSTLIAAKIADDESWKTWDWTHASNSGLYDFKEGKWLPEADIFIEKGIIDAKVVAPDTEIPRPMNRNCNLHIGGMDTVFANALDTVYSSKPYISCGTWTTVSVESDIDNLRPPLRSRFILSPCGSTLEQECFLSQESEFGMESTVQRIKKFLDRKLGFHVGLTSIPKIRVFGSWADHLLPYLEAELGNESYIPQFEFVNVESKSSFLHERAARYALKNVEMAVTPMGQGRAAGDVSGFYGMW